MGSHAGAPTNPTAETRRTAHLVGDPARGTDHAPGAQPTQGTRIQATRPYAACGQTAGTQAAGEEAGDDVAAGEEARDEADLRQTDQEALKRLSAVVVAWTLAACSGPGEGMTAYVGGTLWDGSGVPPIRDAVLLVGADGGIVAVGPPDLVEIPRGAREVRTDGKWIIPGLIDVHVHAAGWTLPRFLAYGVTSVRDAGGEQDSVIFFRDDVNAGRVAGPRMYISGAMIDGPGSRMPWTTVVRTANDARRAVGNRVLIDAAQVKIHARIDRRLLTPILDEATVLETPVAAHLGRVDALTAARAGVASIEHLSGVPEAAAANPAGLLALWTGGFLEAWAQWEMAWTRLDSAVLDRTARALAATDVAIVPTLVLHETLGHYGEGGYEETLDLSGVPDSVRASWDIGRLLVAAGLSRGALDAIRRRGRPAQDLFVRRFQAVGGVVAAGSDAPGPLLAPGAALHRELALLVAAGLTPEQALLAATRDAAKLLGADSLGVLRPGVPADFVILAADPFADIANTRRVERVAIAGTVWTPEELRAGW